MAFFTVVIQRISATLDADSVIEFIYRTEFEGVKILFWQL